MKKSNGLNDTINPDLLHHVFVPVERYTGALALQIKFRK